MPSATTLEHYVTPLLAGQRTACRTLIQRELSHTADAARIYEDFLWPAMERVEKLFHSDRVNAATEHMATRINRTIADQVQPHLKTSDPIGKRIIITCADAEPEELGAQMYADLMESRGWEVYFLGGGVPNDEILGLVGQLNPTILLVFGTQPAGVPGVRRLADLIREIGVNPTMNIIVSGGVFNRAEGLWKEVNADFFAKTASEVMALAESAPPRPPTIRTPGAPKKRRRRRRVPEPTAANAVPVT